MTEDQEVLSAHSFGNTVLSEYRLHEGLVHISIVRSHDGILGYHIREPEIEGVAEDLIPVVRSWLKKALRDPNSAGLLKRNFSSLLKDQVVKIYPQADSDLISTIQYYLERDARGLGVIQPLMDDGDLLYIRILAGSEGIEIHHHQYGILQTRLPLSNREISNIYQKMVNRAGSAPLHLTGSSHLVLKSGRFVRIIFSKKSPELINTIEIGQYPDFHGPAEDDDYCLEFPSQTTLLASYPVHGRVSAFLVRKGNSFVYDLVPGPLSFVEWPLYDAVKISLPFSGRDDKMVISSLIDQKLPSCSRKLHNRILSCIQASSDLPRLIRLMMADPNISEIRMPGPARAIEIHHSLQPEILLGLIPDHRSMEGVVEYFLKIAKKESLSPGSHEEIRFSTGERITITKNAVPPYYYSIAISGNNSQQKKIDHEKMVSVLSSPNPDSSPSSPKLSEKELVPPPADPVMHEKISVLLSNIFTLKSDLTHPGSDTRSDDDLRLDGVEVSLSKKNRTGKYFNYFSSLLGLSRRNETEPEVSELQVDSVLKIQAYEGTDAEEAYWLVKPHAYAIIMLDKNRDRVYRVVEPELSTKERIILEETFETLRDVLVYDNPVGKGELFLEYKEVAPIIRSYDPTIPEDRLLVLYYYLKRNLSGYGKIDPVMHDELLEDISCNGHNLPVYIHHRIYGSIPTSVFFESEELNRFVLKLSQKADKQVSLTSPLLDAALPTGARAQITYSNVVSTKGSSFTIRKFRSDPMTPITLMAFGTYDPELLSLIWLTLENRKSMIIVGGTASGKTSAMNSFSFFIPQNSKIVSLEDTREIQIPHQNWLPVQTREGSSMTDRGNIDLFALLKASLRQRPEYIIVGEVRGNEAQTLFQAMNSGHTTLSTLHAGTVEEALNRLTNEPINVPPAMFGAMDLMVIQSFHYRDGRMIRRCDAIHEIYLEEGDKIRWNTLYEYNPANDTFIRRYGRSRVLENIRYMHNWTEKDLLYHLALRTEFLTRLKRERSFDPQTLIRMITDLRKQA